MISMIGLLGPDQLNLTDYALTAYKRATEADDLAIAWQFQRVSEGRDVTIHSLGIWDTVASVIVPRPDRMYVPSLQFLPYTKQNARVRVFRQACAIDERRRMFRLYRWLDNQDFRPRRFWRGNIIAQDQKQVWFAGVHADIGGGYPERESALSKYLLLWMVAEAQAAGLRFSRTMLRHLALGARAAHARETYVAPSATGMIHRSLAGAWRVFEILPRRSKWLRWPGRRSLLGLYLPLGEPRVVPEGARLHASVIERMAKVSSYRPINLPERYIVDDDSCEDVVTRAGRRAARRSEQLD